MSCGVLAHCARCRLKRYRICSTAEREAFERTHPTASGPPDAVPIPPASLDLSTVPHLTVLRSTRPHTATTQSTIMRSRRVLRRRIWMA